MKNSSSKKKIGITACAGAVLIVLSIVAFKQINHKVVTTEMEKQVSAPATYSIKKEEVIQLEDYVKEDYEIITSKEGSVKDNSAMSSEAAAEIGAEYLWDMFQVSLKGKVVVMAYNVSPINSETRWLGSIYENYDYNAEYQEDIPDYNFSINAITGERQSVGREFASAENAEMIPFHEEELNEKYKKDCDEYKEIAIKFVEKSYGAKVALAEYHGVSGRINIDLDKYVSPQDIPVDLVSRICVQIHVTDTDGIKYAVSLEKDTKELESISMIEPDGGSNYLG